MDFADYAGQAVAAGTGKAALAAMAAYKAYKFRKGNSTMPSAYSNAKKIQRLTKQVRINRGEIKTAYTTDGTKVLAGSGGTAFYVLGGVAHGDTATTREGNKIRIVGWDVRVHTTNAQVDTYLLNSPTGQDVQSSNFHNILQGQLNANSRSDFKEYSTMRSRNRDYNFDRRVVKRLKGTGMPVRFNGALYTDVVVNKLQLFVINRTTTSATIDVSAIVYYTDK